EGARREWAPPRREPVPGAIVEVADEGLHEQAGERSGEPQHGDLVRVGAQVLLDRAHVRHLQRPAELDAQAAEGHVPDLPEAQGHSRAHLISSTWPSWGPSVSGSR